MPAIEVSHLTKEYHLGTLESLKDAALNTGRRLLGRPVPERPMFKALDDISFTVEPGEVVGIIGHNGAGKSTLLKLLARISTPTSGNVKVNGRIAPLIEVGAGFVPDFTGRENVYLNASILGMSKKEIDRKFEEIVDFAEMTEFIDTPVKRYSSGMQVKLAFAVATSIESEILIVDEVLAVGDLSFQQKCIERMDTLIRRDGRTVLVVSHNIRQIERLCTRALMLDHGRLTHSGAPKDICGLFFDTAQQRGHDRRRAASGGIVPQRDAGLIEVHDIHWVSEEGALVDTLQFHESSTLRIRFHTKVRLHRPEIIVGFHTADFVQVLYGSNAMSDERPDLDVGHHEVHVRFNDLLLRPYSYGLRVIFLDSRNATLWSAENVVPVLVTPGRADVTTFPSVGLTLAPTRWKFQRLDDHSTVAQ